MPLRTSIRPDRTVSQAVVSLVLLWSVLLAISGTSTAQAPRSTEKAKATTSGFNPAENAYCDKGNVAHFGDTDGPAQLPKSCYYTGLDGTPSPGKQTRVAAGADLKAAVDGAHCGDVLLLSANGTYTISEFPRKNCDDQHYITVRTDATDSKLPAEGTRVSPAWAGVASLPGRPEFAQPAGGPAKILATILVSIPDGVKFGDHYRFIGLEWKPDEQKVMYRLLFPGAGADHIIFDRNWIHAAEGQELGHGVGTNLGSTYIAVINSYLSGFTCLARIGKCTDSTAFGGGNSDKAPIGPLKIVNNFLEASGENILFGGAASQVQPTDIEIRRNHMFKPMFWNPNASDHREPTPIVKNLLELKNAKRVLIEGNYFENSWAGFSQVGSAIILTPRNNYNKALGKATCPDCVVTDITIRYNWVRRVNQVFGMANVLDAVKPAPGNSYSIHDVVADGIGYPECGKGCGGALNMMGGAPGGSPEESIMRDVTVDHITYVSMQRTRVLISLMGPPKKDPSSPQMHNIKWLNTISDVGTFGLWPAGGTPDINCANLKASSPKERISTCWGPGSMFQGNVLAGGNGIRGQRGDWPEGNYIADTQEAVGYVKLNGGIDGDYHLTPNSKFKGKATDGRDPGADVDAVLDAVKGVQ